MPPKAAPAQFPQVLNRALARAPVPTTLNGPARDALLPWLALGYTPVFTTGAGQGLCGFYALAGSIAAAAALYGIDIPAGQALPDVAALQALQLSQRFATRAAEYLEEEGYVPGNLYDLELVELTRPVNLGQGTLAVLLNLVNEDLGVNWNLGIVTQGFRVIWRGPTSINTAGFDESYIENTAATILDTTIPHDDLQGVPVIWVWYDNGGRRSVAHASNAAGGGGHWENFGAPRAGVDPATDEWHIRVRNWNLGQAVLNDVNNGVWRVTESQNSSPRHLHAQQGHFVRNAAPVPDDVPDDSIYVRSGDTAYGAGPTGTILRNRVVQITMHAAAPGIGLAPGAQPRQVDGPEVPFRIFQKIDPLTKIGTFRAAPITNFEPARGAVLLDTTERIDESEQAPPTLAQVTNIDGTAGNIRLRRVQYLERPWGWSSVKVPILNSSASSSVSNSPAIVTVSGNNVAIRDSFYDNTMPLGKGAIGLRHLWYNLGGPDPRGLVEEQNNTAPRPAQLPGESNAAYLIRRIRTAIQRIIDAYVQQQELEARGAVALPLYTLNMRIPKAEGVQETDFFEGETVRLWNSTQDNDGNVTILDFDGKSALAPMNQLTVINVPFGLYLDGTRLHDEFGTAGHPLLPAFENGRQVTTDPPVDTANPWLTGSPGSSGSTNLTPPDEILDHMMALDDPTARNVVSAITQENLHRTMGYHMAWEARKRRRANP